jgi:VIT1/CCC1 family predicted Fe2+/Mn2+ transporter
VPAPLPDLDLSALLGLNGTLSMLSEKSLRFRLHLRLKVCRLNLFNRTHRRRETMTNLTLPTTNVVKMARLGAALTLASVILWVAVALLHAAAASASGFLMVTLTLALAAVFIVTAMVTLLAVSALAHSLVQKFRR